MTREQLLEEIERIKVVRGEWGFKERNMLCRILAELARALPPTSHPNE
jgi:hypothetical protein